MKTPIADFVKAYAQSKTARFHMPGHKGESILGCEELDITEISGADVLYSADGIINESECIASSLFKSKHSFYSTEGSTLAIKAMLGLIKRRSKNERTTVLAARNVHKAFIYACALLDIDAEWIYPENFTHLCSCDITPSVLESAIKDASIKPDAVYITSPDYLGNIADISTLAKICHSNGIPLVVDNAHGAYLAFTEPSLHPLALGADMCCDSAHKTLPVLTGGAYLHISKNFDVEDCEVREAMSLFASTSPSYLILQSLDLCNKYLSDNYAQSLADCIRRLNKIKKALNERGIITEHSEPLKLVLSRAVCGYSGSELADLLRKNAIEPEFADKDTLVLMATPSLSEKAFTKLEQALATLEPKIPDRSTPPSVQIPVRAMSIRDAIFANSELIDVKEAQGRICASPTVACPPAVPVVMSGELIDNAAVALMLYYGTEKISVVK